jgi:shikimate dehydrogenase
VIDPAGVRVMMIGAGGARRAIAVELGLAGAREVRIVNRGVSRGEDLVAHLKAQLPDLESSFVPWSEPISVGDEVDVLINATSIGLYPDVDATPPVDFSTLKSTTVVADVIPNPPRRPSSPPRPSGAVPPSTALGCSSIRGASESSTGRVSILTLQSCALLSKKSLD